jgi:hypothetical protein
VDQTDKRRSLGWRGRPTIRSVRHGQTPYNQELPIAEAEYIAASGVAKEGVWMRRFLIELGVFPDASSPLNLHCGNNEAIAQAKKPRNL